MRCPLALSLTNIIHLEEETWGKKTHPQFQISSCYFIEYNISWETCEKETILEMSQEYQVKLIKKLGSMF